MRIVISDTDSAHAENVQSSIIQGVESSGLEWSGTIDIVYSALNQSLIDSTKADIYVRSMTGFSSYLTLASANPSKLFVMPVSDGDGTQEQLYTGNIPASILLTGVGTTQNLNDYKCEFFDIDPISGQYVSYSNGYIAGKIAAIAIYHRCSIQFARRIAQYSASLFPSPTARDGFGVIDIEKAFSSLLVERLIVRI